MHSGVSAGESQYFTRQLLFIFLNQFETVKLIYIIDSFLRVIYFKYLFLLILIIVAYICLKTEINVIRKS